MTTPQMVGDTRVVLPPVKVFTASERMNQMLIEHLDPAVWRSRTPGNLRTIAAIFTHMHNVRCKWVRLTAPDLGVPAQLHRAHCSPQQAREGLAESALRCTEMLAAVFGSAHESPEIFRPDGLATAWPAGVEVVCYMLSHEAHHRGQICMLTHQLGYPLANEVTSKLWNWERLWKECGFTAGLGR